jgi:hypothetical protein
MKIRLSSLDAKKLLRNKRVIEEINRHKWLESEIAGYDIGFEAAAEDWLKKHAAVWVAYHANKKHAAGFSPRMPFKSKSRSSHRKKKR